MTSKDLKTMAWAIACIDNIEKRQFALDWFLTMGHNFNDKFSKEMFRYAYIKEREKIEKGESDYVYKTFP